MLNAHLHKSGLKTIATHTPIKNHSVKLAALGLYLSIKLIYSLLPSIGGIGNKLKKNRIAFM